MTKIAYIPSDQDAPESVRWLNFEFVAGEPVETDHPHLLAKAATNPDFFVMDDEGGGNGGSDDNRSGTQPSAPRRRGRPPKAKDGVDA